jgi:hypothetical protein
MTDSNKPPLRLFILRTKKGGSEVRDETGVVSFNNKMAAKTARDELGGDTVVSFGPDHKLYFQR